MGADNVSADARLTLSGLWADGTYSFRLAIGQLRELQDKCNAGPMQIWERLGLRQWRVEDVRETIRLGLIGGGMTPTAALTLVIRYVDERPLLENVPVALEILGTALTGVPDDQPGKRLAGESSSGSDSPSYTKSEPSSDGRRNGLTN